MRHWLTRAYGRKPISAAATVLLAALFALAAYIGSPPLPASAHANVEVANPQPESELEDAPDRIVIQFTEPLEARFSEITLLDANGVRVDNQDSKIDLTDPTTLAVTLPPLENGTYTVSWSNVSTVDGHRVNGAYVFSVGEPISGGAVVGGESTLQSQGEPFFRWIVLLGALAAVGGLAFQALVVHPVLSRISGNPAVKQARDAMLRRGDVAIWAGLGLFAIGSVLHLAQQAATTFDVSFWNAIGSEMGTIVTDTDWGSDWLLRVSLIGVMAALLTVAARVPNREMLLAGDIRLGQALRYTALLPGAAALLTLALISHGAGTAGLTGTALAADFVHLLAAALWVGGLVQLFAGLPVLIGASREGVLRRILQRMVPRFSVVALISAATLILTGAFSAWAQLSAWEAFTTAYGYALIAKLLVLIPLLAAAAFNLLWLRPKIQTATGRAARLMRRFVALEIASLVLVLLAVGYLTALEPGRQVASREAAARGPSFTEIAEGATIDTRFEHSRVGPNNITITITDRRGNRIENANNVEVIIVGLSAGLPSDLARAVDQGNGEWLIEDYRLSVAGEWQIETVVRRPGSFDARTAFRFDIGGVGDGGSSLFAPNPDTAGLLFGGAVAAIGLMILFASVPLGAVYTRSGISIAAPGLAAAVVGLVIIGNAVATTSADTSGLRNPFPPTAESVDIGRDGYVQTCSACHGEEGLGDGPAAPRLTADLTIHVPLHRDGDLFTFMRDGISGTPMKSLSNVLTEDQMWHIVNYVRTLARPGG
ncbi:MAG: copper resistance protein CopC [Chloroflexi bacterium]|nr:copper resistance protein CopC [Chloroflexota bacterium]